MNKKYDLKDLKELIKDIHKNAEDHGWWENGKSEAEVIALIHSELSEALEFFRAYNHYKDNGFNALFHYSKGELISNTPTPLIKKPDGALVELADAVIRIFDFVGSKGHEDLFIKALCEKHEFNKTRTYKHGNKLF